ncbi:MAG: protein kinase [Myxococcaceae bacterium]|nr:protein kinase [Myxococcaceae bacterium]
MPHSSGPGTALSNRIREPKVLDDGNEKTVAGVRINDVLSGRYRLEQKIGEGGMGSVYLATDLELDRKVAVKLLAKNLVGDAEVVERFEREARLTAKLDHPNIVPIYDVGRTDERPFIVMKKLDGDTLAGLLRQKGGLTADETLKLLRQLAAGLDYIHGLGFIHRDVKAGNIFVGPGGHATILDFGILRSLRGHEALTRTGVVMGTPHYMAPEQALGSKDVDHRVDLYALAVVIFECLTGTLPFEADSELRLIQMQAHSPPPDLIDRAPWIARPIAAVMKRALAKRADERFSSGALLVAALEQAYQEAGTAAVAKPAEPVAPPPEEAEDFSASVKPSRGPYLALALAVVAIAALAVLRPWDPAVTPMPIQTGLPAVADAGVAEAPVPDAGEAVALVAIEDAGEPDEPVEPEVDAGVEEEELAIATVDAGRRAWVKSAPKKGKLNVLTAYKGEPYWAQVLIDGVSKGRTPLLLELPTGKYLVRVERPGFKTQSREIRVASGKAAVVRIDLTQ